jgi:hypothetical protein
MERYVVGVDSGQKIDHAISFRPTNPTKDGAFRKIEIKTQNKEWKVQARKGYYAINPESGSYFSK